MIKNVIFDLDGTLLDTTEGIVESVNYVIREKSLPSLSYSELLTFVGPPIQDSFVNRFNMSKSDAQNAANIFREYYKEQALFKAKPYEGIFDLLENLKSKGYRNAVATYKREDYAIKLLKYFDFDKYMFCMHGADNDNILKKKDIIEICISELGSSKEECVLIGDTKHDEKGAFEAGVNFIGVSYGFGYKPSFVKNEDSNLVIVDNPIDILNVLYIL